MTSAPLTPNPLELNPDQISLVKAGALNRNIGASLERVWENVADWAHLPWLHNSNFTTVALDAEGSWGWRAWLGSGPGRSCVELVMDKPRQTYVARTIEGSLKGMEIWTTLKVKGPHVTGVDVTFHVPDLPNDATAKIGTALETTYQILWDEDEGMMQAREHALARHGEQGVSLLLGSESVVRAQLPLTVDFGGRTIRVVDRGGKLIAFQAMCPHMLRPLDDCPIVDGVVTCPWHGYRFDISTGRSPDTSLYLRGDVSLHTNADSGELSLVYRLSD
jgi:nitrite reductase/ring-hydroxylating ferredoxin subunit